MAWQLIYTSAPRLLEAGRTGFGTVARHRAVGGLLAAAVERFSQFARLAGLGPRRVIQSHRIVTAGAGQFHVLSCIRDAGSDYTGRTNHLAHHLIAETREVRALMEAGITPADVLLQMNWRSTWTEPPRFLEPAEEIALSTLRSRALGSTWERVTGSAEHAALPNSPSMQRGCFLVLPGGAEALQLFRESLIAAGAQAWQTTFTTSLEPNDDVADFRWIAVAPSSPLRPQAESASRPVLDLTQPQTLPQVEAVPTVRSSRERLTLQESPVIVVEVPARAAAPPLANDMEPLGSWPQQQSQVPRRRPGLVIVAASLGVIAVGAMSFCWLKQKPRPAPHAANGMDLAARVDELWRRHHLQLPVTANWLKGAADPALVQAHEQSLKAIALALRSPGAPAVLSPPESTQDEFMELLNSFTKWHDALRLTRFGNDWTAKPPLDMKIEAGARLDELDRLWAAYARHFTPPPADPSGLRADLQQRVLARLAQAEPTAGWADEWLDLLESLGGTAAIPGWLDTWAAFYRLPAAPAVLDAGQRAQLARFTQEKELPPWLRDQVQQRQNQTEKLAALETEAEMHTARAALAQTPAAPRVPADAPTAVHPLFVVIGTQETSQGKALESLPPLAVQPDMHVFAGEAGAGEKNLLCWKPLGGEGVFRKSFNEALAIEIKGGKITRVPDEQQSWRVIGRTSDDVKVLFEVVLIAPSRLPAEALCLSPGLSFHVGRNDGKTTLGAAGTAFLQRLRFAGTPPALWLQRADDVKRRFRLDAQGALTVEGGTASESAASARMTSLDQEIQELRAGIQSDEKFKKALLDSNLTKREKEEGERRYDNGISGKQAKILQILDELKTLAIASAQPAVGIAPGRYTLVAVLPGSPEQSLRLCEVEITSEPSLKTP